MARIMLCDDSSTTLTFLEKSLRACGHEVAAKAKDGDQGIATFEQIKPDLLILDVTMPNKDGRECLKAIMTSHPDAKIVMLTALVDQNLVDECMNLGAKAFLSKASLTNEDFVSDLSALINKILTP